MNSELYGIGYYEGKLKVAIFICGNLLRIDVIKSDYTYKDRESISLDSLSTFIEEYENGKSCILDLGSTSIRYDDLEKETRIFYDLLSILLDNSNMMSIFKLLLKFKDKNQPYLQDNNMEEHDVF